MEAAGLLVMDLGLAGRAQRVARPGVGGEEAVGVEVAAPDPVTLDDRIGRLLPQAKGELLAVLGE